MKKCLLIVLIILIFSLVACKGNNNQDKNNDKTDEEFVDFEELEGASYIYFRKLGYKQVKIRLEDNDSAKELLANAELAPKKELGLLGPRSDGYVFWVRCNISFEHDDNEYELEAGDVVLSGRNIMVVYDTSHSHGPVLCTKIGKVVGMTKEEIKEYFSLEESPIPDCAIGTKIIE